MKLDQALALLRLAIKPQFLRRFLHTLRRADVSAYYEVLGDDVLEGCDGGFRDDSKPLWLNLGYWAEANTYPDACAALASKLAERAELGPSDEVLDVGFGYGEQDFYWVNTLGVRRIVGLNVTPLHVELAQRRVKARGLGERIDLRLGSATAVPLDDSSVDKVVALESAFHFNTREVFFREAWRVLRPGGVLCLADMVPRGPFGAWRRARTWFARRRLGIPSANMYGRDVYDAKLRKIGFIDPSFESIRGHVFPGAADYAWQRLGGRAMNSARVELTEDAVAECKGLEMWAPLGFEDYLIVRAKKPCVQTHSLHARLASDAQLD
jgi:microcystin synthetase protein McyJ